MEGGLCTLPRVPSSIPGNPGVPQWGSVQGLPVLIRLFRGASIRKGRKAHLVTTWAPVCSLQSPFVTSSSSLSPPTHTPHSFLPSLRYQRSRNHCGREGANELICSHIEKNNHCKLLSFGGPGEVSFCPQLPVSTSPPLLRLVPQHRANGSGHWVRLVLCREDCLGVPPAEGGRGCLAWGLPSALGIQAVRGPVLGRGRGVGTSSWPSDPCI